MFLRHYIYCICTIHLFLIEHNLKWSNFWKQTIYDWVRAVGSLQTSILSFLQCLIQTRIYRHKWLKSGLSFSLFWMQWHRSMSYFESFNMSLLYTLHWQYQRTYSYHNMGPTVSVKRGGEMYNEIFGKCIFSRDIMNDALLWHSTQSAPRPWTLTKLRCLFWTATVLCMKMIVRIHSDGTLIHKHLHFHM